MLDKPFSTILVLSLPWLVVGIIFRILVVALQCPLAKIMNDGEDRLVSWWPGVTVGLLANTVVFDQCMKLPESVATCHTSRF